MNIDRIDLNLLKIFRAIAQEKQLSKAGYRLGLTQPAMSHALKRLRLLFEDELFMRTPNGMEPTARALELSGPVTEILDKLQNSLHNEDTFDPSNSQLCIRLGITDYGSVVILPAVVHLARRHAPQLSIQAKHISYSENYLALDDQSIDIAIMSIRSEIDSRFCTSTLFTEDPVCVVSKSNKRVGDKISLKTYQSLNHISVAPRNQSTQWAKSSRRSDGIQRHIAVTVPHFNAVPATISGTDLVATLPYRIAKKTSTQYKLKLLPLPFKTQSVSMSIVWHKRNDNNKAHQWFREMILRATSKM